MEIVRKQSTRHIQVRNEFIEAQRGLCAICLEPVGIKANLDHCHQTGFIRGVLCTSCNVMLGWYESHRRGIEGYLARAAEFQAHNAQISTGRTHHTRTRTVSNADEGSALVDAEMAGAGASA